jgi:hypothetical protein
MLLCSSIVLGFLFLGVRRVQAFAGVNLASNWKAVFAPSPVPKQRYAYLTDFRGFGLTGPLAKDLAVYVPSNPAPASPLTIAPGPVVAVLENVAWSGGVQDPIAFSGYMSAQNATLLRLLKSATLKTIPTGTLGFWAGNYDPAAQVWFGEFFPKSSATIQGQLNAPANNIRLTISDAPVRPSSNTDLIVYNVSFEVIPASGHPVTLNVASSSAKSIVLPWGK